MTASYLAQIAPAICMRVRGLIFTHLPVAVVASVVIALFNLFTGENTTLIPLTIEFLVHVVAIFLSIVAFDLVWQKVFDENHA